ILALLTIVGSVFLVSRRLSSDRELVSGEGLNLPIGEQTLEARLWEDPFSVSANNDPNGAKHSEHDGFEPLLSQIQDRTRNTNRVLLLPVMLSGGSFGEDQESRIRSRFAIVSALAQSGYAPQDAEFLGATTIPWPNESE